MTKVKNDEDQSKTNKKSIFASLRRKGKNTWEKGQDNSERTGNQIRTVNSKSTQHTGPDNSHFSSNDNQISEKQHHGKSMQIEEEKLSQGSHGGHDLEIIKNDYVVYDDKKDKEVEDQLSNNPNIISSSVLNLQN